MKNTTNTVHAQYPIAFAFIHPPFRIQPSKLKLAAVTPFSPEPQPACNTFLHLDSLHYP
jgi:hypothetical protein